MAGLDDTLVRLGSLLAARARGGCGLINFGGRYYGVRAYLYLTAECRPKNGQMSMMFDVSLMYCDCESA